MRAPDYTGPWGTAWKLDEAKLNKESIAPHSGIAMWVIHVPQSHPHWPWVRLSLIHLRDVPGLGPAHIFLPGATHEIIVQALNPDHYPPSVDSVPVNVLRPINFGAQFISASDEDAIKKVEHEAVYGIVHGHLNPDTDGMRGWIAIFGDNMIKKGW
jgi:hypothetical protein